MVGEDLLVKGIHRVHWRHGAVNHRLGPNTRCDDNNTVMGQGHGRRRRRGEGGEGRRRGEERGGEGGQFQRQQSRS